MPSLRTERSQESKPREGPKPVPQRTKGALQASTSPSQTQQALVPQAKECLRGWLWRHRWQRRPHRPNAASKRSRRRGGFACWAGLRWSVRKRWSFAQSLKHLEVAYRGKRPECGKGVWSKRTKQSHTTKTQTHEHARIMRGNRLSHSSKLSARTRTKQQQYRFFFAFCGFHSFRLDASHSHRSTVSLPGFSLSMYHHPCLLPPSLPPVPTLESLVRPTPTPRPRRPSRGRLLLPLGRALLAAGP